MLREDILINLKIIKENYFTDIELTTDITTLLQDENLLHDVQLLEIQYNKVVNKMYTKYSNDIAKNNYQLLKTLNGEYNDETDLNPTQERVLEYSVQTLKYLSIAQLKNIFETMFKFEKLTENQVNEMKELLFSENISNIPFGDTQLGKYVANLKK